MPEWWKFWKQDGQTPIAREHTPCDCWDRHEQRARCGEQKHSVVHRPSGEVLCLDCYRHEHEEEKTR